MKPRTCQAYLIGASLVCIIIATLVSKIPAPKFDESEMFHAAFYLSAVLPIACYAFLRILNSSGSTDQFQLFAGLSGVFAAALAGVNAFQFLTKGVSWTTVEINYFGMLAALGLALLSEEIIARCEMQPSSKSSSFPIPLSVPLDRS